MKKILEPAKKETAIYYSDFKGKLFDILPEIEITFKFNYGSGKDEKDFTLYLTEDEYKEVEQFLSQKLLPEVKKEIKIV